MSEARLIIAPAVDFQLFSELQPIQGKLKLALGIELTEEGKKQAQAIADVIDTVPRTVYTSPAEEAYLAAQIIATTHKARIETHNALRPTENLEGKITTIRNIPEGFDIARVMQTLQLVSRRYETGVGIATTIPKKTNGIHALWKKIGDEYEELMDEQSIIVVATQDTLNSLREHVGDKKLMRPQTIREYTLDQGITGPVSAKFAQDYKF